MIRAEAPSRVLLAGNGRHELTRALRSERVTGPVPHDVIVTPPDRPDATVRRRTLGHSVLALLDAEPDSAVLGVEVVVARRDGDRNLLDASPAHRAALDRCA